ncbi:MAG: DciA family protein [Steroidobacteraceae bacterium]
MVAAMQKPKSVSELLARGGKRLSLLKVRCSARVEVLAQVRAALSPRLRAAVVSAGLEQGRLTIGVVGAQWASRLRYSTDTIVKRLAGSSGAEIHSVRIRVVPPPP